MLRCFLKDIIGRDDTPFIYEKIGTTFQNFLIDEFQGHLRPTVGQLSPAGRQQPQCRAAQPGGGRREAVDLPLARRRLATAARENPARRGRLPDRSARPGPQLPQPSAHCGLQQRALRPTIEVALPDDGNAFCKK